MGGPGEKIPVLQRIQRHLGLGRKIDRFFENMNNFQNGVGVALNEN